MGRGYKEKQKRRSLQSKNGTHHESDSLELNADPKNRSAGHFMNGRTFVNHNELPADTQLSQIAMLGSHDAGTYAYSRKRTPILERRLQIYF
ncbi:MULTISPECIES: hypothetical protein [Photorhabdus]|uniref:Uncharacterized protein n=1 Tax=Photorhabdus thracensis TaxID=230089 RepID=A0A0F7LRC5_9GAMM|nr:hypothetical protein [Photorhabdus thracensis]AKH65165.1 hypothetical protein VY86_19225 [Photorhabdus thracensis]MCC8421245.1 hypothetical protein [Photorhabdus thracensis]